MENNLKIIVEWDNFMTSNEEDKKDSENLAIAIGFYIKRFGQLPLMGMYISDGYCDPSKIQRIHYQSNDSGDDSIYVFLEY